MTQPIRHVSVVIISVGVTVTYGVLVTQDLMCHKLTGDNLQPGGTPGGDTTQPRPPEVPPPSRLIRDFDDSANALWTLQMKEAKCHDEARIKPLEGDMNSIIIFVRVPIPPLFCTPS